MVLATLLQCFDIPEEGIPRWRTGCPGETLALRTIVMVRAALLQCFDIAGERIPRWRTGWISEKNCVQARCGKERGGEYKKRKHSPPPGTRASLAGAAAVAPPRRLWEERRRRASSSSSFGLPLPSDGADEHPRFGAPPPAVQVN
ncbi:hypothetical protein ZWY2020_054400 [Hordeum vulgare]|nr:hypothetical protein ZWY2020_054400 [Hordeum vulgare]